MPSVTPAPRPVVLVPACNRQLGHHPFHIVGKKYVDAVRLAGCQPLVVPGMDAAGLDALLDLAHGVLLTGSPSNVHPSHFGEPVRDPALPLDADRDALTLPLIWAVLDRGMPLFGICRGTQETNVALGGSLHQAVQDLPLHADHRSNDDEPVDVQYGAAHPVHVVPGGLLEQIVGRGPLMVNSLHGQGVHRLAPGLRVEARAPDGLIEAFSVAESKAFVLCVQWHPEWQAASNPQSMQMLQAFGNAARSYRDRDRQRTGLP